MIILPDKCLRERNNCNPYSQIEELENEDNM